MDICNIYKKDCIFTKPHLVLSEKDFPDPRVASSPASTSDHPPELRVTQSPAHTTEAVVDPVAQSPVPEPGIDMEMERPRNVESQDGSNFLNEFAPTPARSMASTLRGDDFTHVTMETELLATPDLAASTGTRRSELETPMTFLEERLGLENTALSDIPDLMNSAELDVSPRASCYLFIYYIYIYLWKSCYLINILAFKLIVGIYIYIYGNLVI